MIYSCNKCEFESFETFEAIDHEKRNHGHKCGRVKTSRLQEQLEANATVTKFLAEKAKLNDVKLPNVEQLRQEQMAYVYGRMIK